jgi:hypothetical protein
MTNSPVIVSRTPVILALHISGLVHQGQSDRQANRLRFTRRRDSNPSMEG